MYTCVCVLCVSVRVLLCIIVVKSVYRRGLTANANGRAEDKSATVAWPGEYRVIVIAK